MKKVVIVGAGVAGSYLANLIQEDYEIVVYEGYRKRGCRCGWGSSLSLLKPKLEKIGLDLTDYWLCKPDFVFLNGVRFPVCNCIFFNKRLLLQDMLKDTELVFRYVNFGEDVKAGVFHDTDIIVNATGKPLVPEQMCYTVQWKMMLESPEEKTSYVWFNPEKIGYGWVFPLDEAGKVYHVGAGSLHGTMDAVALTKEVLYRYNFQIKKIVCGCKKQLNFGQNLPVFQDNIVSIGEAVGCVHPLTGEGILPSMKSAELLAESLREPSFPMNYVFHVEQIISEYEEAFQALETLKRHRRIGMIKLIRTMTKRLKQRTKPGVTWTGLLKALSKVMK